MENGRRGARPPGYAVTVAFDIVEGKRDEFAVLIAENAAASVRDEAGCLRFDVLTPLSPGEGPDVFLYEIYRDRAAFDRHLASGHYKAFDEASRTLIRTKTVMVFAVAENAK
jgi:(4S)-4-hydroxy-5-phosphonooxypentane-2,3-dione isomerase